MTKLYRIKPVDKKSIYAVYDVYKKDENSNVRGFIVREMYRWGQGFRELDDPVHAEDTCIITDPNLGWGCELDDMCAISMLFSVDVFIHVLCLSVADHWLHYLMLFVLCNTIS